MKDAKACENGLPNYAGRPELASDPEKAARRRCCENAFGCMEECHKLEPSNNWWDIFGKGRK